ncbi:MAG TPA: hypothetical protein QGF63_17080 [Alphaproteobacteria bacterium]|jgi:hypothetical protein|nr:hypothetical protein [Alphaproteobacteria bacterium]MDP6269786.1 hypothetical protein [Alphaproteobacteria bacterium]MDP7428960.1 hypothetical protein [Alphaproteobacteria bacterium]HJM51545.1 hypothetical protein [Alphaproteobacteria bacterium]|tara:strand:- start:560 stop:826 length:267 start_codon:yes stop_codon:yes gene_type:complete
MDDALRQLLIQELGPPLILLTVAVVAHTVAAGADLVAYLACEAQAAAVFVLLYVDAGAAATAEVAQCLDYAAAGSIVSEAYIAETPTL